MNASPAADSHATSRQVAVVTDSTPYLPRALIERWAIRQVSLYVGWDGDLRAEDEYRDLDAFYRRLHDSPRLPTTSQPSVGDFLSCYEPLLNAGCDVVSIHIAGGLSGTCESAREAARILAGQAHPGRVEVLDSQTGAGGLGCLTLLAADSRRRAPRSRLSSTACAVAARASTSGSAWTPSSTCAAAGASAPHRRSWERR